MKQYLQIKGNKVAFETAGRGNRLLLMLHGWGGESSSWQPLIAQFENLGLLEEFLIVAVDFPGFGESEEPEKAWAVHDYARFLEEFIGELYKTYDLSGNYDIIVHSFGGRVLFKLLSPDFQHSITERPDRLVLIAAAGIKPRATLRVMVAAVAARTGKAVMKLPLLRHLSPLARKILYKALKTHDYEKSSGIMRETFIKVIDEDLRDSLLHIKNPTLIFWGKKDSYVSVKHGRLMHEKIPGSKMVVFADGRHGIHKTKSEPIAREIANFLHTHAG